jgi:CRP-like cAMP-binding protein
MALPLNSFSPFGDAKFRDMELAGPLFESYSCAPGTRFLQQGEPANYLYFIVSGCAEVMYQPHDGDPITVAHVKRGGWVGWSAVVGSGEYTSSAMAIEPLEMMRVRASALRKFCGQHPEAAKALLDRLVRSVSPRRKSSKDQVKSILIDGLKNT